MSLPVVFPLLIPLVTALAALSAWQRPRLQQGFSVAGAALLTLAALQLLLTVRREKLVTVQAAGWPAPYGITLAVDLFSALLIFLSGLIALAIIVHALIGMGEEQRGGFHPLLHFLLVGICGVLLAGDIFNLYVWFEVMLIASFVLMTARGHRRQLEGGVKYLTLNFLASVLLLSSVGLLYGAAGTLNLAHLARLAGSAEAGALMLPAMLLLAAFGIKSALFPFFFWLPASYHTPAPAIAALFAALLTKVSLYALIRVFTLLFLPQEANYQSLLLILAGLTLLTGALGSVVQEDFRRVLSFLVVSHSGYLLMGLGFYSRLGLAGAIFFTVHLILANAALFLVAGLIRHAGGSYRLTELGGLFRRSPAITLLFLLPAVSLAEIPPLPGFWGKLLLLRAGLEAQHYLIIAMALAANLLTIYALIKIWNEAFWKQNTAAVSASLPFRARASTVSRWLYFAPVGFLSLLILAIGLMPEPLAVLSLQAADQLLNSSAYVQAVFGGHP